MVTSIELPSDRVYNDCKAIIHLDHGGHITVTYIDTHSGDDIAMAYLGKEEIETIVQLYMDNHDLIENEGEVKKDATPAQLPIQIGQPVPINLPSTP